VRLSIVRAYSALDSEPLHNERYPLRLGEGVFVRNRFSEDIFKKAAKAFRHFHDCMEEFGVTRYRAVATSATREAVNLDPAAFTRWCEDEVYTPAIRRGTEILERVCDLHLLALHRELGIAPMLATPRTAREVADQLGFEASAHIALEALLTRLAERTGVVSVEQGPPARFQARADVPDGTAELTALRSAMAELGPGFVVALEFLEFGRAHFVTALRDDPGMMDRVLSGADAENYPLWARATNADPMQDLHGQMGAGAITELFPGGTILEIGGGTGNGIRHLFDVLQARGTLDRVERYIFTDVSPRFILGTRRAIREAYPSVACDWKYLDINKPFSIQGIEPDSVDLIYGVNAAHVAKDALDPRRGLIGRRQVSGVGVKHAVDVLPRLVPTIQREQTEHLVFGDGRRVFGRRRVLELIEHGQRFIVGGRGIQALGVSQRVVAPGGGAHAA